MPVIVSMLRGVNVGGHNMIRMDALRTLYISLKLLDPQTYVQSGNVVFRADCRDLVKLADQIEIAIERSVGFRPRVILRTAAEMREVVARNPFATRRGIEPNKLTVIFPRERSRRGSTGPAACDQNRSGGIADRRPRTVCLLSQRHGTLEIHRCRHGAHPEGRRDGSKLEQRHETAGDGGKVGSRAIIPPVTLWRGCKSCRMVCSCADFRIASSS